MSTQALADFLRPEFLARVDEVIVFRPLSQEDFQGIARLIAALDEAGVEHVTIQQLRDKAYSMVGVPDPVQFKDRVVATTSCGRSSWPGWTRSSSSAPCPRRPSRASTGC